MSDEQLKVYMDMAFRAHDILESRTGAGSEFLGWLNLPSKIDEEVISECNNIAALWRDKGVEIVVVLGIGGSYLGAKAALDALSHSFADSIESRNPKIVFAGNTLSEEYLAEVMDVILGKSVAVIVISKSGTTLETAISFRVMKHYVEMTYGSVEARERIVAITDREKGALRTLVDREGYRSFVLEDDIGGRFSVLSPVGLLPVAVAGFDVRELLNGAIRMESVCGAKSEMNPSLIYAAVRNFLYDNGKKIEILVSYHPKMRNMTEWWKQLYGESEGKEGKGIFPVSVINTMDLHSMGQYIQDGERTLFETVISIERASRSLTIPEDPENMDGLNFLSGKHIEECNVMAGLGTKYAHIDGGVPNVSIVIGELDEFNLGELFYFFERACGVSGYMLGVNPFDQPGVEAYKKNMFALLGKPGYEEEGEKLRKRIKG